MRFYERPYLRLSKPEIKESDDGKVEIQIGVQAICTYGYSR
ncbi:MAG: hypothetical protein SV062_14750 [Thermodesulfobacteriota bacterium]|nr:hypothetical protein [Thermodesulfobacteriota bacterium]